VKKAEERSPHVPPTGSLLGATTLSLDARSAIERLLKEIEGTVETRSLAETIGLDPENHPFPPIKEEALYVLADIRRWCIDRDIWPEDDEQGIAYTSMVAYLHAYFIAEEMSPEQQQEHYNHYLQKLTLAGKLYSWLFYLDDAFGNDVQQGLPAEGQVVISACIPYIFSYLKEEISFDECDTELQKIAKDLSNELQPYVAKILTAFSVFRELSDEFKMAVLEDAAHDTISSKLPIVWLKQMMSSLKDHLLQALSNQDNEPLISVWEYIERRRAVSGMAPAVDLIQFVTGCYLDNRESEDSTLGYTMLFEGESEEKLALCEALRGGITIPLFKGIAKQLCPPVSGLIPLRRVVELLRTCCIDYGGLVNDLVSLHKELQESSVFNIVAITYLFTDLEVLPALAYVNDQIGTLMCLIQEYSTNLVDQTESAIDEFSSSNNTTKTDEELLRRLKYIIRGLLIAILSTYYWQISPEARPRYGKSAQALFTEFGLNSAR
jgi:hypothetical protein